MPNQNLTPTTTTTAVNDSAIQFLRDLMSRGFWGNITLKIQHGDVIHLVREESIPADKLIPNNRSTYVNNTR